MNDYLSILFGFAGAGYFKVLTCAEALVATFVSVEVDLASTETPAAMEEDIHQQRL